MQNVWGAMAYVEHQVEIAIEAEPQTYPNELGEAQRLAGKIIEYWAAEGKQVQTWIERSFSRERGQLRPVFNVRSSMVGGKPASRQMSASDLGL